MKSLALYLGCVFLWFGDSILAAKPPASTDDRLVIELVAREPEIVTPTGVAVDERGRIWVIENHTHQRQANYQGPGSDRIRIFEDFNSEGRPRRITTFAEGFHNAMSIALSPNEAVFLATRSDIYLLEDKTGKGIADQKKVLIKLETAGTYPHNGLSGFAFDPLGYLVFALGENLGADYKLIGSDGTTLTGGGEGGSIYRCRPDGTKLARIATGFWNTFHLTVDAFGRLFAVDNDPDSRGPCRLLHIVPGGDYGYRYRNGRKGLHPFTAWNGELPGTLPMIAGTSEAPSGIVAYESNGLPQEYRGNLLVTSWGDHVIERFQLEQKGASFQSKAQIVVRGDENFRPVAIATAPDGSLYVSDWVDKSYPVHGKGRIWRIRKKNPPSGSPLRAFEVASRTPQEQGKFLSHPRQEIGLAAGDALARKGTEGIEIIGKVLLEEKNPRVRIRAMWACAKIHSQPAEDLLCRALKDPDARVRGEAVRLLGEISYHKPESRFQEYFLEKAQTDASSFVRLQAILQLRAKNGLNIVVPILADPDPFLAGAAIESLSRSGSISDLTPYVKADDPKLRLGVLTAMRRTGNDEAKKEIPHFLADPDPTVRRAAIQWVGEERLDEFGSLLRASASRHPITRDLVEAFLATNQLLAGEKRKPAEEISGEEYIVKIIQDLNQPPAFLAVGLRMIRPDHPALKVELLQKFFQGKDKSLQWEAVRTLAMRNDEPAQEILRKIAGNAQEEPAHRSLAIMGLAHSASVSPATQQVLGSLLLEPQFQIDTLQSLRSAANNAKIRE
ncbi:MAG TPA: PVC-type heme-binding CxxCH protein, partial [Gemmataceae bacterium]|nr:PVC-type heme-binding CxxCH protein [Gemmataceae bacterium]